MPKKVLANSEEQDALIEEIRHILFGEKGTVCVLHEIDQRPEVQQQMMDLIPRLRSHFLIHNIPGVQRPHTLKRPWLSIMKAFLRLKYHVLCENYLYKKGASGTVATKRYVLLPKDAITEDLVTGEDDE